MDDRWARPWPVGLAECFLAQAVVRELVGAEGRPASTHSKEGWA